MDSVNFGGLFAFTAIDILTREADVLLTPELTGTGYAFSNEAWHGGLIDMQ